MTTNSVQQSLFANADEPLGLTTEDLDEWIADVQGDRWDTHHCPNDWARNGLAELLGEPVPYRVWTTKELLTALTKARTAVQS